MKTGGQCTPAMCVAVFALLAIAATDKGEDKTRPGEKGNGLTIQPRKLKEVTEFTGISHERRLKQREPGGATKKAALCDCCGGGSRRCRVPCVLYGCFCEMCPLCCVLSRVYHGWIVAVTFMLCYVSSCVAFGCIGFESAVSNRRTGNCFNVASQFPAYINTASPSWHSCCVLI